MEKQAFEYGGFHFIPERRFTAEENSFLAISRRQRLDKELGFCKPGYAYKSKYPYSHESFYAASPDKECDLFRCVENGKLYLPCIQELCQVVIAHLDDLFNQFFHVVPPSCSNGDPVHIAGGGKVTTHNDESLRGGLAVNLDRAVIARPIGAGCRVGNDDLGHGREPR